VVLLVSFFKTRTEAAQEIPEHVYLDGIIKERRNGQRAVNLDDLLTAEGMTRADLEKGGQE